MVKIESVVAKRKRAAAQRSGVIAMSAGSTMTAMTGATNRAGRRTFSHGRAAVTTSETSSVIVNGTATMNGTTIENVVVLAAKSVKQTTRRKGGNDTQRLSQLLDLINLYMNACYASFYPTC